MIKTEKKKRASLPAAAMYRHFPQVDASDFAWAGAGRSTDQRNKYRVNYDECRVNGITIHTGDFVLLGTSGKGRN